MTAKGSRLAALVVAILFIAPRAGATGSSITISTVSTSTGRITISGTVTAGDSAKAAVSVFDDPAGDSLNMGVVPDGLDLGGGSIRVAPDGKLVFTINTYNMTAAIGGPAPTFVYNWHVVIDGNDNGHFLQAGYIGGWGATASTGKFFNVCRRAGEVTCTSLGAGGGTIGNNTVTINVAPGQILAKPGSVISGSDETTCISVCSTWQPVLLVLYNAGGDQAAPSGYLIPGGVQLTVVPTDTDDQDIDWSSAVSPNVQPSGNYSGTFSAGLVAGVEYKAAARTCSGSSDAPVCLISTKVFTA